MATLTQSARIPGPSWDETIVPALRKRLESESRTLAKRMSAVSITSLDEPGSSTSPTTRTDTVSRDTRTAQQRQVTTATSSAQPRYNNYTGTSSSSNGRAMQNDDHRIHAANAASSSAPQSRSRTYSQPYASDRVNGKRPATTTTTKVPNGTGTKPYSNRPPTSPDSNRSVSPALSSKTNDPKPTRIPKPRARTTSASSSQQPQQQRTVNGYSNYSPIDLYPVHESTRPPPTARSDTSSIAVPSRQGSGILNESPPFKVTTSSITSNNTPYHQAYASSRDTFNNHYDNREPSPARASSESEERPFEHWYRGEVSRNGGVGELRVAKRMEMLEIANFGHTIQKRTNPVASLRGNPNANGIVGVGMDPVVNGNERRDRAWRRKRADSVSGILGDGRESLYLDDERAREVAMVLDEHPPTDLDDDDDHSDGDIYRHYVDGSETETEENTAQYGRHGATAADISAMSAPTPTIAQQQDFRSATPTNYSRPGSRTQNHTPSRIPTPSGTRKSSDSQRPNPPPIQRGASEPPPQTNAYAPSSSQQQQNRSAFTSSTPNPKVRGKSPASGKKPPSASAKARAKALAAKQQQKAAEGEKDNRRSVAQYPTPDGDEGMLADAIPTWTQPKPKTGNWDEVVLPVVARKKGLDDHYEQADGSPRAKQEENVVAPAPGTFGYDHTKYRQPRSNNIPMDEFGRTPISPPPRIPDSSSEQDNKENVAPFDETKHAEHEPLRIIPIRRNPATPPPFSHYMPTLEQPGTGHSNATTMEMMTKGGAAQKSSGVTPEVEEEGGAGCCKCVIM